VTDDVYALMGDGSIRHLPGGIEQYVDLRHAGATDERSPTATGAAAAAPAKAPPSGAVVRAARKEVARLERALDKLTTRETQLHEDMAASATDHTKLRELQSELSALLAEREALESAWLETSEALEG
jgi:ATP-binding cassette subfamily F protein uup